MDNFILSNKKRNLVDKFEKNRVYKFNLSSQKLLPRQLPLSSYHNMQTNVISK